MVRLYLRRSHFGQRRTSAPVLFSLTVDNRSSNNVRLSSMLEFHSTIGKPHVERAKKEEIGMQLKYRVLCRPHDQR